MDIFHIGQTTLGTLGTLGSFFSIIQVFILLFLYNIEYNSNNKRLEK
jgi:hypothetical protein